MIRSRFHIPRSSAAGFCRKWKIKELSLFGSFYHFDGPGQIPHLDALLSIPELQRQSRHGMQALNIIANQIGAAKGTVMLGDFNRRDQDKALKFLAKHGAA